MSPEEIELNHKIDQILATCDGIATPRICQKLQSEAGLRYVKSRIIYLIDHDGLRSVEACLSHIEQELDGL